MKKILIIEDEYDHYEDINDILNTNFSNLSIVKIPDIQLDNIKKGENISEFLKKDDLDLIILDLGLIGENGIESDSIGKNLYYSFPDDLKKITVFVSQVDSPNLTKEMTKKFFNKSHLETNKNFINCVSEILSVKNIEKIKEQKNDDVPRNKLKTSHFIVFSALVLMLFVILYALVFMILKINYLFNGNYETEDIVHFVESFFLVALPIFMSYAIFIFAKKIVGALADGNLPEKGTINDSVKIIGMVKNLFIGSIISYISLSLISNLFDPNMDINISQHLVALGVIIVLVLYWRILSKH